MAYPSYSYTFTNGGTISAAEVNQNFTDILYGISDGTKDINVLKVTAAGLATLSAAVILGTSSANDVTFNGSLASTIPVKTTATYNIGDATHGLNGVYLGASTFTTLLKTGATASYTIELPPVASTAGQELIARGTSTTAWLSSFRPINLGVSASVGSSALTIALKGADGNDPSATNPVYIPFRNATSATGTPVLRAVTGALSVVVSSGSTLGHTDTDLGYVWVYAIDNAGTVELAVSGVKLFNQSSVVSTTAEGGGGAADDGFTMYSTTARTNVACVPIARLSSTQTTAGTWAAAISEVSLWFDGRDVQVDEVWDTTPAGHGSTNTRIRRIETNKINRGTAITRATSSTAGNSYTINRPGVYAMTYVDRKEAGTALYGLSYNSTELTTSVASISDANRIIFADQASGLFYGCVTTTMRLDAGDVVRCHTDANPNTTAAAAFFHIVRVSD